MLVTAPLAQQVILWELDTLPDTAWSCEDTTKIQFTQRQLKLMQPQVTQLVALRPDQASLIPLWYDSGADAVITTFTDLVPLTNRLARAIRIGLPESLAD